MFVRMAQAWRHPVRSRVLLLRAAPRTGRKPSWIVMWVAGLMMDRSDTDTVRINRQSFWLRGVSRKKGVQGTSSDHVDVLVWVRPIFSCGAIESVTCLSSSGMDCLGLTRSKRVESTCAPPERSSLKLFVLKGTVQEKKRRSPTWNEEYLQAEDPK
jgi:hypothetical protein